MTCVFKRVRVSKIARRLIFAFKARLSTLFDFYSFLALLVFCVVKTFIYCGCTLVSYKVCSNMEAYRSIREAYLSYILRKTPKSKNSVGLLDFFWCLT